MPDLNARYEIRSRIAIGGGGTVHLGWDREMNREVAIKRAGTSTGDAALWHEAAVLRGIQHPNIVRILDSGHDAEGSFLVMELVKGRTLEEMVAHHPLDMAEFEQFVMQTLEGIIEAHANEVVHLDLKPQNIMIEKDTTGRLCVKILDFGVARTAQPSSVVAADTAAPVMGSLYFMAPERFDRESGDVRADLYSLGCVFYFALTQQPPFQGDTAPQVMVAHMRHDHIPLAVLRPDLPAFTAQWIEWLMRRNPGDRPADATAALAAFRARRILET